LSIDGILNIAADIEHKYRLVAQAATTLLSVMVKQLAQKHRPSSQYVSVSQTV
jgi:hypothetical protein